MRPRRARREARRVMEEEAEREASAYVQRAMAFSGLGRRLTVVAPLAIARAAAPTRADAVADQVGETVRKAPSPAIPVGLPEGATLAPMTGSRDVIVPFPARAPAPVPAPGSALVVTPTPAMAPVRDLEPLRTVDPLSRPRAGTTPLPAVLGLSVLALGALVALRRASRP